MRRGKKKDSSDEIFPTRTNVSDGMTIGTLRRSAMGFPLNGKVVRLSAICQGTEKNRLECLVFI